jgi:glycosyltransferase involved in cell wall biosynthesis
LNEERNLPRTLNALRWAQDVLVLDCGSQDRTCEIARSLGARVEHQDWLGYGAQKNRAQALARFDWVLNIDADEVVTPELESEIRSILDRIPDPRDGFEIARKTFYLGRWIRHGGWYPSAVTRLAHRAHARWSEPSVHEKLEVPGQVHRLKNPLLHFTFRDLQDQVETNLRYAREGAQALERKGERFSLVKLLLKSHWKFFDCYVLKRGFLDGLPGFLIAVNAAYSVFLKYAFLRKFPDV